MKLHDLLAVAGDCEVHGPVDVEITGIVFDSRQVSKGHLFAALPGQAVHGSEFLNDAKKAGAAAVLSDKYTNVGLPMLIARNPRPVLARLCNHFYDYPSSKLKITGVTGTNGKTTITYLLRSILQSSGFCCGMIGSILYSGQTFSIPSALTTPEAPVLQELLHRLVSEGCESCVMEVSSHGLCQSRVAGCEFETAIFTNLTHEHLDYHKTMEEYFQAKTMLFDNSCCRARLAVINLDDPYGARLKDLRSRSGLQCKTYGFHADADFRIQESATSFDGSWMKIVFDSQEALIRTELVGEYNLSNVCGAFAAAVGLGLKIDTIQEGIAKMACVPGRMERLNFGQPFQIMIDYAHTEDALRQLLPTLRRRTGKKLIHIFGCRGARDRAKRPKMGRASGELADVVILTSDNPDMEDPHDILQQVYQGAVAGGNPNVERIIDRADAIGYAVNIAQPGDTIVITGKGNETYQKIGGVSYPFDEREIFRDAVHNTCGAPLK